MRLDRSIIEGLQDIVLLLEDQLKPLVQAELSLLVDILYSPELLFLEGTEARKRCESGGFIRRFKINLSRLLVFMKISKFSFYLTITLFSDLLNIVKNFWKKKRKNCV